MWRAGAFVVGAVLLFATAEAADAAQSQTCFLIITEHWPKATEADQKQLAQLRRQSFDNLSVLLASAYKNGGYEKDPASFPVHHLDLRDDHIVADFHVACPRARLFLGELLQAYRQHFSSGQKKTGPDLQIENRDATEYEARCGLGATQRTCPLN